LTLTKEQATGVLRNAPWVLSYRPERSLRVLSTLGVTLGFTRRELSSCVARYPRLLCLSPDGKISELFSLLARAAADSVATGRESGGDGGPGPLRIPGSHGAGKKHRTAAAAAAAAASAAAAAAATAAAADGVSDVFDGDAGDVDDGEEGEGEAGGAGVWALHAEGDADLERDLFDVLTRYATTHHTQGHASSPGCLYARGRWERRPITDTVLHPPLSYVDVSCRERDALAAAATSAASVAASVPASASAGEEGGPGGAVAGAGAGAGAVAVNDVLSDVLLVRQVIDCLIDPSLSCLLALPLSLSLSLSPSPSLSISLHLSLSLFFSLSP